MGKQEKKDKIRKCIQIHFTSVYPIYPANPGENREKAGDENRQKGISKSNKNPRSDSKITCQLNMLLKLDPYKTVLN